MQFGFVFDGAATHVGATSQMNDDVNALQVPGPDALGILRRRRQIEPARSATPVGRRVAVMPQCTGQVATDEAAGAGYRAVQLAEPRARCRIRPNTWSPMGSHSRTQKSAGRVIRLAPSNCNATTQYNCSMAARKLMLEW